MQVKSMMQANAVVSSTPWNRMSRRLASPFKKSVGLDRMPESSSDRRGITRSASSDSLSSTLSRSSSSFGDSIGLTTGELGESANLSQKLSSSFRKVLVPLALDSSLRQERLHTKAKSESRLDSLWQQASASYSSLASSSRSRSSNALSGISSNSTRDSGGPSSSSDAEDPTLAGGERGSAEDISRRQPPLIVAPTSPSWRSSSRVVPLIPVQGSERSSDGRSSDGRSSDGTTA